MKVHTNDFKNQIKEFGREIDSKITYTLDDEVIELGAEELNSITPHYEGAILKSVMKQLDIDSNIEIPIGTILTYEFGLKIDEEYEYINFGNYVVYDIEKQEDTGSYKITCYDKMLYSMKDYENMNITYPITIRNYINTICNYLGLTFANASSTFANYDRQINAELYLDSGGNSLNYTFRDVLDELAQATGSTVCINDNDELEIRYITSTSDTIDEEYLKDVNVNFGEKYGPVNSIVLSRSAESDNVYIQNAQSIADNGLCEIKIVDNQIMNWNDRSDYLPDLLTKLGGLEYYLNDYSSTGICYYDLCDRYNVSIGENTYSCVMLNDEINITQGLEELVYTEMPEQSETDYTKADKTDRKINQTYLIVDKQNQAIEGVVSQVSDQNEQIATIRLQYNELLSRISDIADITTSGESTIANVPLVEVNASQPIDVKIHPIGENISYLYPYNVLYPSSNLFMNARVLRFTNTTTSEIFDYPIPTDLWYYDSNNYDELEMSYGDGTNSSVIVTRRCEINADNTVSVLDTPTTESYEYPSDLYLTDGDYTVQLLGHSMGYLYVQLMAKNIYTTQFYTKAETNSLIDQTASSIDLSVNQKLSNYSTTIEMNSAISIKADEITSSVSEIYATKSTTNTLSSRISQTAKGISLTVNNGSTSSGIVIGVTKEDGTTTSTSGTIQMNGLVKFTDLSGSGTTTINGSNITTGTISANRVSGGTLQGSTIIATTGKIGGWDITSEDLYNSRSGISSNTSKYAFWAGETNGQHGSASTNAPFRVGHDGSLSASNAYINGVINASSGSFNNVTINGSPIYSSLYKYAGSAETVLINDGNDGMIEGYYTGSGTTTSSTRRFALASFNTGGRFQTFDSSGNMSAYFNQTGSHTSSDIRYKKHIENIDVEKSFNIIKNLTPITYDYNDNVYHRGLSAQEVEKVLKDNNIENQIYEINEDGRYSLNYVELIPDLINCIKYQQIQIKNLQQSIEKLKKESDK